MKFGFGAAVCAALCSTAAAQTPGTWYAEGELGLYSALYNQPDLFLIVSCPGPGQGETSIEVEYGFGPGAPKADGLTILSVDGRTEFDLIFSGGRFVVDNRAKAETFRAVTRALKAGSQASVSGTQGAAQFSLRGSSRAIGDCAPNVPENTPAATTAPTPAPSGQNLVLFAEEYLVGLGYAPGAVDGVVDSDLQDAIMAWQRDNGMTVTGGLTLEDFRLLEGMATGATEDTSSAPPAASSPTPSVATRIQDCGGERGAGFILYQQVGFDPRPFDLTDYCLDEAGGALFSAEPISGLQKTIDQDGFRTYELVPQPAGQYVSVTVTNIGEIGICDRFTTEFREFGVSFGQSPSRVRPDRPAQRGVGYIIDGSELPAEAIRFPEVRMTFIPLSVDGSARPLSDLRLDGISIVSDVTIDGGSGSTTQIATGYSQSSRDENGRIAIQVGDDGTFRGSGKLAAQSSRITGFAPGEWRTVNLSTPDFIGHVTASGRRMLAIGRTSGTVDIEGAGVRAIEGYSVLLACR